MKTIQYIFLSLICFTLLSASETTSTITSTANPDPTPFLGTWQYQNGNQLFTVYLWEENDDIIGTYEMVEYNNGVAGNIIYSSIERNGNIAAIIDQSNLIILPSIIGKLYTPSQLLQPVFSGSIDDSTMSTNGHHYERGNLTLEINYNGYSSSCNICPFTLTWKVTPQSGMQMPPVYDFNIPTDITLIKVSGNIDELINRLSND